LKEGLAVTTTNEGRRNKVGPREWADRFAGVVAGRVSPKILDHMKTNVARLTRAGFFLDVELPEPSLDDLEGIGFALSVLSDRAQAAREIASTSTVREEKNSGFPAKWLQRQCRAVHCDLRDAGLNVPRPRVSARALSVAESQASTVSMDDANKLWSEATKPGASAELKGRAMEAVVLMYRHMPGLSDEDREARVAEARRNLYGERV
jgi:hypothetical protein